ncbi:UbiA prenyltransferase family [Xylaria sp. CBS 124048]|nr:UbiA prenyltransferase family [Xylaria sp. CBS 124048]
MSVDPRQWAAYSYELATILWGFTEHDFVTFAIPNSIFGMLGAMTSIFVDGGATPPLARLLRNFPLVLFYNWSNLLIFDMANQRSALSMAEDAVNKPWRPLASGRVTSEQTRRGMLVVIPLVLLFHHHMGLWSCGLGIQAGIWVYNELGGGDEAFLREILIAIAYGVFNYGSFRLALGRGAEISSAGMAWIVRISAVVLTTMQIQDLKDMAGDRLRNRKTIALLLGEGFSRASVALLVCFWSYACARPWDLPWPAYGAIMALGGLVATRVLSRRNVEDDRQTWRLWCFWLCGLYLLPLASPAEG